MQACMLASAVPFCSNLHTNTFFRGTNNVCFLLLLPLPPLEDFPPKGLTALYPSDTTTMVRAQPPRHTLASELGHRARLRDARTGRYPCTLVGHVNGV